ncbi:MAG TPA: hypothetical protein VFV58_06915 [Blastocatellia bacterium]|jgi:hypothetical protein|nr:hypothetical protein [Blastocatellia bacterium]
MKLKPRYLLIGLFILIDAAVAAGFWAIYYWPPVIRNHYYRELVVDFQRAQIKARIQDGDEKGGWDFQIQMPGSKTTAQVKASSNMGIATIRYSDEGATRKLYVYADYSSPAGIRIGENLLYVYWTHTLFNTKHWILAYDLVGRREITRCRIDPNDLGWSP